MNLKSRQTAVLSLSAILFEILCYSIMVALPYSYQWSQWTGVIIHYFIMGASVILDFLVSPIGNENVSRIAAVYKVHRFAVYGLMAANLLCANVLVVALLDHFGAIDAPMPSNLGAVETIQLLKTLASYFIVSEVAFTSGHLWLHRTTNGMRVHHLHHLCRRVSWSTNMLFHPVDIAIEFGVPSICMSLMQVMNPNPFAFRVAIILLYIFYAADHSANLGLPHGEHHLTLGARVMTVYGKYGWFERLTSKKYQEKLR